jgi:RNA polymerase sigma factor (sigma-70 family)
MNDDLTLLREFARNNSETAFAEIVSRHVNLVYSVALRQTRDSHLAEEITQAVFIILARKADSLGDKTILPGWLCRTARYASANALTIQRRRHQREQEAHMQSILNEPENETWPHIAPLLDGAMDKLGQKDHDALVLRFFENKNFAEVGAALGASEDAAKMRVNRALEKLRKFFTKRGVVSTTAIIAGTISANSVQAAPVALAKSVTAVAIAKGAAASASTLTLIKGALKLMAWTKAKTAIVVGVSVLLTAGTATVTFTEIRAHQNPVNIWFERMGKEKQLGYKPYWAMNMLIQKANENVATRDEIIQKAGETLNDPRQNMDKRWPCAYILSSIGDKRVIPVLVLALKDKDFIIRGAAATALGAFDDPAARSALETALLNEKLPTELEVIQKALNGEYRGTNVLTQPPFFP